MSNSIGGIKRQKQYLHLENHLVVVSLLFYPIGKYLHCFKKKIQSFLFKQTRNTQ